MKKIFLLFLPILFFGCSGEKKNSEKISEKMEKKFEINGVEIEILKNGTGAAAKKNDNLVVHYDGFFENGLKFDSSRDRKKPFNFTLGGGQVIKGWDAGIENMKIGEIRKLKIPPEMAYGSRKVGPISENSTLIFEIELLEIREK